MYIDRYIYNNWIKLAPVSLDLLCIEKMENQIKFETKVHLH